MRGMCNHKARRERGVALMLALLFVTFFSAVLVSIANYDNRRTRVAEAEVAGWELVELAKAARLYVRDQMVTNANLRTVAQNPSLITITNLKNGGYLSPNFGRPQIGGTDRNALDQEVYIIMANWSSAGLGGDPADDATVPSAFIYFRAGGKSTSGLVINVIENARKYGATITAPLFNGATNVSANCRTGGPANSIWDTGCLTDAEFQAMAAAVGLPTTFGPGAIIMPAWKATQQDLRAVMRFPQPDNPGYSTMLTDLELGTPTVAGCANNADQVSITTLDAAGNPTTTYTGLCKTNSDTAAAEQRYDMLNVANLSAERVIAEPQALDLVVEGATAGNANEESLSVSGNVTMGNDLRIFNTGGMPTGMSRRLEIPNGMVAIDRNAYLYSQNAVQKGTVNIAADSTAGAIIAENVSAGSLTSTAAGASGDTPTISVTTSTNIAGDTTVSGDANAEIVAETLTANNARVRASNAGGSGQAQITNTLNMSSTGSITVAGSAPVSGYAAISGDIDGIRDLNVTGSMNFLSANASLSAPATRNVSNTGPMPSLSTNDCLEGLNVSNACPNRQYFPPNITP